MTDHEEKKIEVQSEVSYVSLLEDPYGFRNIEIAHAQQSDEVNIEEDIEEDLEKEIEINAAELDQTLENIAGAIAEETERQIAAAEAAVDHVAEAQKAAEQLAAQIAEDQALQAQLAAEQAEAETMEEEDPELQAALPQSLDVAEIESCIETLLFLSDKPLSVEKLQEMLGPDFPLSIFQEAVTNLRDRYQGVNHGIEIVEVAKGLQLRTKPGRAALARKLAKVQTQRLSSGAMETLAIIAYRQPAMKDDIDKIRGVDSSYFIRGLLDRKLIEISGRSELPGRPCLYSTTREFLEVFGLKDLSAMPSLREIEQMIPSSQTGNPEDEDPRVKQMRQLVGQMNSDTSTSLIYDHREDEQILQDIRSKVNSISTSTPYLEEQKALEKAALEAAKNPKPQELPVQPELVEAVPETLPETAEAPALV